MSGSRGVLLLWVALGTLAWPQGQPPQGQPEVISHEAPATFSSRVNLVSVPVVVRDRDGHPIGSLKQEDFQLFDKGKPQVITKFSMETSAGIALAASAAKASERQGLEARAPQAPEPALPQRFVAYLFDDVHMKVADLLNARKAANQHLDQSLDANTRAAIFAISGQVSQDFTGDLAKLHATVNQIHPWEGGLDKQQDCPYVSYYMANMLINQSHSLSPGLSDAQVTSLIASDQGLAAVVDEAEVCLHSTNLQVVLPRLRTAAQTALRIGMEESIASLNLMRDLIRSMSGLPGSRTIVMVSPGFLLTSEHRINENDIFDKAIHANVTINTLDARGLATIPGMEASDKGYQSPSSGYLLQTEISAASQAQDLLAEVAAATGGTFFHNSNALEEGLKELAARPEYLYVLGYSPDNLKFDGGYHKLKVTLRSGTERSGTERSGTGVTGAKLDVEARRGYWAPNHALDPAEEAREEIQDAVFSNQEIADIPLKLHTEFFKQSEAKAELTVETRVDLKGLKFKKTDDRNRDSLIVVTGMFDENGRYVKGTERTMEMQLRDQTLEGARNSGMLVKESFEMRPGRYVVRVVVRDSEGRSMAAQTAGVEIP